MELGDSRKMHILAFTVVVYSFIPFIQGTLYDPRECKKSREGSEYMGSVSTTRNGTTCQRWDSQFPHSHPYDNPHMFPDRNWDAIGNKCRNPDAFELGPWCYTIDPFSRWEFCEEIEECPEFAECGAACKPSASCTTTEHGTEYVGKRGMTDSGRPCQRWDRQFPHEHNYTDAAYFPDETLFDAENFCRHPRGDDVAPWCLTTDSNTRWEYCGIPVCTDCKQHDSGREFAGTISTTVNGLTCQRWDSQEPHPHDFNDSDYFPDVTLGGASNYCRNPDGREGGVWCYTVDPDVEWEFCNVSNCEEDCGKDAKSRRTIKHVLQIGFDGLHHDCWLEASGGAPNFLRMAAEGAYTFYKSRTDMYTFSAPGWSSQLCGMDIEQSGCITNSWEAPWMGYNADVTPVTGTEYPLPCAAMYLKGLDANIRTASFYNWAWIYWLFGIGAPGSTDNDVTVRACSGDTSYTLCDISVVNQTVAYLENVFTSTDRSYTFMYMGGLDVFGHTYGWCTQNYLNYIDEIDVLLGQILDVVEGEEVLVLLSTDHGGHLTGHGSAQDSDLLIPMFIKGPGVKVGYEMQLESRNIDMLPTLVWAMGYELSPQWNGHVMYEIFEESNV